MSEERGEWTGSTYEQEKLAVRFLGEWINDIEAGLQEILAEIEREQSDKMSAGAYDRPSCHLSSP